MKKARIITSLVLAIKNYFKTNIMAKKTAKETTEEVINDEFNDSNISKTEKKENDIEKKEESNIVAGHTNRAFRSSLNNQSNG